MRFTVYGEPQPAGSKRGFYRPGLGVRVVDANPKAKDWKGQVAREGALAMDGNPMLRCPIVAHFTFFRPRPKAHYGTGRNAAILKRSAPALPAGRPDALKLARAVEDALSGVVYSDDALIVREHLIKEWGEPARVEIMIEVLP